MKKVFSFLLAMVLVLALAACQEQAQEAPTTEPTAPVTESTEKKPATPISSNTPTLGSGSGCAGDTGGSSE